MNSVLLAKAAAMPPCVTLGWATNAFPPAYEEAISLIAAIDLTQLKAKLCLPEEEEGKGWTEEYANLAELWYKRFLTLNLLYPTKSIVPTKMIDDMWHAHILDTQAYIPTCDSIFGDYLHHFPYFGLRGEDDAQDLQDSFKETCDLFVYHFKESPANFLATSCRNGGTGNGNGCSRNVKASKCGQHNGGGTGCSRK